MSFSCTIITANTLCKPPDIGQGTVGGQSAGGMNLACFLSTDQLSIVSPMGGCNVFLKHYSMHHYLMLSRENFYGEKLHGFNVLSFCSTGPQMGHTVVTAPSSNTL